MASTNIQIAVRARPLIEREQRDKLQPQWKITDNNIVQLLLDSDDKCIGEPYSFDHIFDDTRSNRDVYDSVVRPLVLSCLEGFNSTIFAYGQTSSGKTYTVLGDKDTPGIISFTVDDIFRYIKENSSKNFLLRCSFLEIYNEKINDLLDTKAVDLKIREDYTGTVYVSVKEEVVQQPNELSNLMKRGLKNRKIGCTDMNERSSRSHTIFKLVIQCQNKDAEGSYTESILSLVDLAGSERVGQMNMNRDRQIEGVCINKSLSTLGLVIRRLSENESYINYRDSKLTRLLQHSLGGNSRTLIIATVTVATSEETKSTLDFAQRAKYVKNRPIINNKITDKDQLKIYEHLCEDYKGQIEKLSLERAEKEKTIRALENKVSNIKLFTESPFEIAKQTSSRRHTLGHYATQIKDFDSNDLHTNDTGNKLISPVKSDTCLELDRKKSISSPPYELNKPTTPRTPYNFLKQRLKELERSHEDLKLFTNLENQIQLEDEQLTELRELVDSLKTENIKLIEENISLRDADIQFRHDVKSITKKLKILQDVLASDEVLKKKLCPIMEENEADDWFVNDRCDLTMICEIDNVNDMELRQEITEKEEIIARLNEENELLKEKNKSQDEAISKLRAEIVTCKDVKEAEQEILNEKINKFNIYKEKLHKKIDDLQTELEIVSKSGNTNSSSNAKPFEESNRKLEKLTSESEAKDSFHESFRNDCNFELDNLTKEIGKLRNDLENKNRDLARANQQNNEITAEYNKLINECEELRKLKYDSLLKQTKEENVKLKQEIQQLTSDLKETAFELTGEQKEVENLCQQLEEYKVKIDTQEQIIVSLKNIRKEKDVKIQELNEQIKTSKAQLLILQNTVKEQKDDLEGMRFTCDNLRNQLNNEKNEGKTKSADLEWAQLLETEQKQIVNLEDTICVLREQIASLKQELYDKDQLYKNMVLECETEKCKNEGNLKTITELCENKNQYQSSLDEMKSKLSRQETELAEKNELIECYSCQLDKLKQVSNDLELVRQKENQQLIEHISLNQFNSQEIKNYQAEIRDLKVKLSSLESELNDKISLNKNYVTELKEYEENKKQFLKLQSTLKSLEQEMQQLMDKNVTLQTHIKNCDSKIQNYQSKVEDLQLKLTSKEEEIKDKDRLMESCRSEINEKTKQELAKLQNALLIVQQEKQQLITQKCSIEESVSNHVKKIDELKDVIYNHQVEIEQLKKELLFQKSELQNKNDTINSYLSDLEANKLIKEQFLKLQAEVKSTHENSYSNNIKLLEQTIEENRSEISCLKAELSTIDQLNKRLTLKRDAYLEENKRLKDNIKNLNSDLKELKSSLSHKENQLKKCKMDNIQLIESKTTLEERLKKCENNLSRKIRTLEEGKHLLSKITREKKNTESAPYIGFKIFESPEIESDFDEEDDEFLIQEIERLIKRQSVLVEQAKGLSEKEKLKNQLIEIDQLKKDNCNLNGHLSRLKVSLENNAKELECEKKKLLDFQNIIQRSGFCFAKNLPLEDQIKDLVNSLQQARKDQENLTPPRLSRDGRSLSPNRVRKVKRQSLHDQKRGLLTDVGSMVDDKDRETPNVKKTDLVEDIKVNKETQTSCDLPAKYQKALKLAILRRREGNYLRAKLGLQPDCPVLPEDWD